MRARFTDNDGNIITAKKVLKEICSNQGSCYHQNRRFDANVVLDAANDRNTYQYELLEITPPGGHFFEHTVTINGTAHIIGFSFLGEVSEITEIPTASEKMFCKYLLDQDSHSLTEEYVLFYYSTDIQEHPILPILKSSIENFSYDYFQKIPHTEFIENDIYPHLKNITKYTLQAQYYYKKKYGFLELYRSIESVFLHVLLKDFNANFMSSPKRTVEKAQRSLNREREQLGITLARLGQTDLLEEFGDLVDALKSSNEFAATLKSQYDDDKSEFPQSISKKAWKGIWYIYQIRCSIAHAGATGLVFEDFSDSIPLLIEVYPTFEKIVYGAIGFKPISSI